MNCCLSVDQLDGIKISKNMFYKLFIYNEYVRDTYHTNILFHYENILKQNKFIVSSSGNNNEISTAIKK